MADTEKTLPSAEAERRWFSSTHWSVVLAAFDHDAPQAAAAMEELCRTYWYPLYVFVRRQGRTPEDAQDLTQSFFARLLERDYLGPADPQKGRFRSFLLTALKHFVIDESRRARAQKRGGGQAVLALADADAEERYRGEPASGLTPEAAFDQRWAWTVLDAALRRLRSERAAPEPARQFERLQEFLSSAPTDGAYAAAAADLGMTARAVGVAVSRLRQRYRELVREQVAHTVSTPADVDEELRYLTGLVAGGP